MQSFGGAKIQHLTPLACAVDLVPPSFAGIYGAVGQPNGSILTTWSAATDSTNPVTYEIYCLPGVVAAATLFLSSVALATRSLSAYVFRDSNGAILTAQTYTFGVRARDAVNNLETNLVTTQESSLGVLTDDLATIAQSLVAAQQSIFAELSSDADFVGEITDGLESEKIIGVLLDSEESLVGVLDDADNL